MGLKNHALPHGCPECQLEPFTVPPTAPLAALSPLNACVCLTDPCHAVQETHAGTVDLTAQNLVLSILDAYPTLAL